MELIDSLAEEFNQNTVLFVGSGASASAGMPSWGTLVSWLKDYTVSQGGDVQAAEVFLESEDLIKATSSLTSELEKLDLSLTDFFQNHSGCSLFRSAEPQEIHKLLANLPTLSIITPNYDLLLEKTYGNIQVVHRGDINYINKIQRNRLDSYLYKYHGCITQPEKIVLDHSHYRGEIHNLSIDQDCLKNLIQTKTIVFIGAGLDDPDFAHVRDNLIEVAKAENFELWAFMKNCKSIQSFYKKEYGVNLINYEGEEGDHSDLLNKLQELIDKIKYREKNNNQAISLTSNQSSAPNHQVGLLRDVLEKANNEVTPLDEQIIGVVSILNTAEKETCIEYLCEYKQYTLIDIHNRIDFLVSRGLLKETRSYYLPTKKDFCTEAAKLIEDDFIDFIMEKQQ